MTVETVIVERIKGETLILLERERERERSIIERESFVKACL